MGIQGIQIPTFFFKKTKIFILQTINKTAEKKMAKKILREILNF